MQIEAIKSISQSNISIARLIKIMKANKNDSKIIEKCCNRIRELANNEENRIEIGRTDGIKVILQSMRIHIDVALVQVNACAALQKLAFADSKYVSAVNTSSNGAIALTNTNSSPNNNLKKQFSLTHLEQEQQEEYFECCSSPEQLNNYDVHNMKQIIYYGGQEDILNAMKNHPDHLPVQLYGICALVCFTFSSEYLHLLNDCGESKYLLEAAARRFPGMCKHDARNVLDRLSELA